MTVIFT